MDELKGFFQSVKKKFNDLVDDEEAPPPKPTRFSTGCSTDRLHITVRPGDEDGLVYVASVEEGSELWEGGVRSGDRLLAINSNEVTSYDDFLSVIEALPRPIDLTFCREVPSLSSSSSSSSSSSNTSLSAEEREAQRTARLKAAQDRQTTYTRNRTVKKSSPIPTFTTTTNTTSTTPSEESEETRIAREQVKKREQALANEFGYNPYEVKKMSNGQARNAILRGDSGGDTPTSSSNGENMVGFNQQPQQEEKQQEQPQLSQQVQEELEEAVQALLQHYQTDNQEETVLATWKVLGKVLKNLQKQFENPLYRQLRLSNAKIESTIGSVEGAMDLLLIVGFEFVTEEEEAFLKIPSTLSQEEEMDVMRRVQVANHLLNAYQPSV